MPSSPGSVSASRRWTRLGPAAALLLLAAAARAAGRKPPALAFEVEPSTVTAGRTLVVRLKTAAPIQQPRLVSGSRAAAFYPVSTGTWRALWGVSSQEPAGEKTLRAEALWRKRVVVATVTFSVADGGYPISRIPLTKQQDNLFTSGQLAADNKALAEAYGRAPLDRKLWSGYFVWPTTGIISSVFGARRAYGDRPPGSGHSGTDIANAAGTPITAPARGRVVLNRWFDSFGHTVLVEHGQGVFTYYLHMKEASAPEGAMLNPGDPIGLMGKEGLATGPHLHWSMVVGGERVDPVEWTGRAFE